MRHGEILGFSNKHWINVSRIKYPETKCDKGYEHSDLIMMMMACDYEKCTKLEKMSSPIHMVGKEDDNTIGRCVLLQDGNQVFDRGKKWCSFSGAWGHQIKLRQESKKRRRKCIILEEY